MKRLIPLLLNILLSGAAAAAVAGSASDWNQWRGPPRNGVLPEAGRKVFRTASAGERGRRREEELARRGQARPRQELLQEILRRDELDSTRPVAPLRPAPDALVVDTDGCSVGEALEKVLGVVTRPATG